MGRTRRLWELWFHFNLTYFGGKLVPPTAIRITRARKYDGTLYYRGNDRKTHFHLAKQNKILVAGRLSIEQQSATLLHEMVHQYQVQILKIEPDHGLMFRCYCSWIERQTKFKLR